MGMIELGLRAGAGGSVWEGRSGRDEGWIRQEEEMSR